MSARIMTDKAELKEAADVVSKAIHRVYGFANALSFLSEAEVQDSFAKRRFSEMMDALEELSGAIKDSLAPAIEAADVLADAFAEEGAA